MLDICEYEVLNHVCSLNPESGGKYMLFYFFSLAFSTYNVR